MNGQCHDTRCAPERQKIRDAGTFQVMANCSSHGKSNGHAIDRAGDDSKPQKSQMMHAYPIVLPAFESPQSMYRRHEREEMTRKILFGFQKMRR